MSAKKATASTTNPPPPPQSDSDDSDATITPSRQLKRSRESPCASPPTTITPEALAQRKIARPRPRTNPKYTETAVWAQEYREKEAAREAVRAAEAAKAARATQAPPPTPPTSSSPPTSPAAQLAALRRNLDAIRDILTAVSPTSHGAQWAELQTTVKRAVHLSAFNFFPASSAESSFAAPPSTSTSAFGCASSPKRNHKMSGSPIKKRTKKVHKSPSKRAAIIGKKRGRGSDDEVEPRGLGEKRVRGGYMQEGDDPIEYESDDEEEEYTPKVWTAEELRDEDDEDDDEDPWVRLGRVKIIMEEETVKTPVKRKVEVVVEEEEEEEEEEEKVEEVEELEEVVVVERTNKKLFTGAKVADIEGETLEEMGLREEAARKAWEEKTRREAMKGTPAKNQQQATAGKKRKTEEDGQGSAAKKMTEKDLRRKEKRNHEEDVDDRFGKKPKNI